MTEWLDLSGLEGASGLWRILREGSGGMGTWGEALEKGWEDGEEELQAEDEATALWREGFFLTSLLGGRWSSASSASAKSKSPVRRDT